MLKFIFNRRYFEIIKGDWLIKDIVVLSEDEYRGIFDFGVVLRFYIKLRWYFLC